VCDFYVPLSFQFPLTFASYSILNAGLKFRGCHSRLSKSGCFGYISVFRLMDSKSLKINWKFFA
jgi:hypothetical protein